jgi:hypothetical protein
VQTVKANLGPVTEEQIPYLKAAYARKSPALFMMMNEAEVT